MILILSGPAGLEIVISEELMVQARFEKTESQPGEHMQES